MRVGSETLRVKVYYSLLFICYLEVLLWTTCLLAASLSGAASHSYLIRETDNLRLAGKLGCNNAADLPPPVPERLEHLRATARNLFVVSSTHDRLQPSLSALRTYQVVGTSGLPAPYTGIATYV